MIRELGGGLAPAGEAVNAFAEQPKLRWIVDASL
jgi:hypothetical protein